MIQNLNLGPPIAGKPTLKSQPGESKNAGSESFGKSLEQQLAAKEDSPRAASPPMAEKPVRAEKAKSSQQDDSQSPEEVKDPKDPELQVDKGKPLGKKVQTTDREKAIQKFMDSFESEFGIPPTRLVEAIANLDKSEQMKSPEETADAVIAQLGLNEKDQDRARAMYASLLVNLNKADIAQAAATKPMLTEASKSFGDEFRTRMQNISSHRLAVNDGVDRLNQKFWMKPAAGQMPSTGLNGLANPDSQALSRMMVDDSDLTDSDVANAAIASPQMSAAPGKQVEIPPHLRGQLEQNATPAMMAALAAKLAQAKAAEHGDQAQAAESDDSQAESTDGTNSGKTALENLLKRSEAPASGGLGALAVAVPEGGHSQAEFGQSSHQQEGEMAKNLSQHVAKNGEKLLQKSDFKQAMKSVEGLNPQALAAKPEALPTEAAATATAAGATAMKTPASGEHETNIRQLMNQAQYLIKKGGGEVKVQMTPEGMGPIHLKVALQDGKVNVQMSATTDEAKKAIESSLADLKTSLAAHKLSVDHVKVDVVNNTSTDTATQNQMNNHAGRDSARQFWNQFNDNFGSQSQRDGFVDMVPLKGYAQPKRDPLQPIETAARTRSIEGKGQGLNLVA